MSKILSKLFSKGIETTITALGDSADKIFTSKEEKLAFELKLQEVKYKADKDKLDFESRESEVEVRLEEEYTKRLESDNKSASWLTRNIRPILIGCTWLLFAVLSILSGSMETFKVPEVYIEQLGKWGNVGFAFYFGARTIEKVTKIIKG